MILKNVPLTPGLRSWLESIADPPLLAVQVGADVIVRRRDGSEPSLPETARVHGLLAAHRVEPLGVRRSGIEA
jgi:hypothetical protein